MSSKNIHLSLCWDALPTRSTLYHRSITHLSDYPFCPSSAEFSMHCLRDCFIAKEFWLLCYPGLPDNFFSLDLSVQLTSNLSSINSFNLIPWPTWFSFALWTLWIKRNNNVFSKPNPTTYISFSLTISSALNFFFSQSHQGQGVSNLHGFPYQLDSLPSNLIQVDASFLPTSNLCIIWRGLFLRLWYLIFFLYSVCQGSRCKHG